MHLMKRKTAHHRPGGTRRKESHHVPDIRKHHPSGHRDRHWRHHGGKSFSAVSDLKATADQAAVSIEARYRL